MRFIVHQRLLRAHSGAVAKALLLVACASISALAEIGSGKVWTAACAHRGDLKNAPENTLPAFELAVQKGAAQIEFDVTLSRDRRLVILHDSTVDRTTNGRGRVAEMNFAELRKLDAGSWFHPRFAGVRVPTLEETLESIPPRIICNVHLKQASGVALLAAKKIAAMGRLKQCFLACDLAQASAARKTVPGIQICNMQGQRGADSDYPDRTISMDSEYIQLLGKPQDKSVYKSVVKKLHRHGVMVNHCCASDEDGIRFLAEAGVDYILTDDLDLCLKVLAKFGDNSR